jgi:hypothetical protein
MDRRRSRNGYRPHVTQYEKQFMSGVESIGIFTMVMAIILIGILSWL